MQNDPIRRTVVWMAPHKIEVTMDDWRGVEVVTDGRGLEIYRAAFDPMDLGESVATNVDKMKAYAASVIRTVVRRKYGL